MVSNAAWAVLLCMAVSGQQGARLHYNDRSRTIIVDGDAGTIASDVTGGFSFVGSGSPLSIQVPEQGATLTGKSAEGTAGPATNEELTALGTPNASPRSSFVLRTATVRGSAKVVLDTLTAFNAQTARAQKENRPVPPPLTSNDHTELDTESFSYSGTALEGTLTIPGVFVVNSRSAGTAQVTRGTQKVPQTFVQTLVLDGISGVMGVDPTGKAKVPLRTGTFKGPIKFRLVRNAKTAGVDEPTVTINGTADEVQIDMTKPRGTIVARGNVHFDGVNGPIEGTADANILTITLDENQQPVSVEYSGTPTKSTYTDRRQSGGGGR
jgi:hypothetical protein